MNLYDITSYWNKALEMLPEDATPELLKEYNESLDLIEGSLTEKVQNIAKFIKNIQASEKAYKEEADRLSKKAKAAKNKADSLKNYLKVCLSAANINKIEGVVTVALQKNPPSLKILDGDWNIPEKYYTVIPEQKKLDRTKIKNSLKLGETIQGCSIEQTKSVRLR